MRRKLTIAVLLVLAAAPGFAVQDQRGAVRARAVKAGASVSAMGLLGRLLVSLGLETTKTTSTVTATTTPPPADVGGGMDPDGKH
jgi:hypothetical protein